MGQQDRTPQEQYEAPSADDWHWIATALAVQFATLGGNSPELDRFRFMQRMWLASPEGSMDTLNKVIQAVTPL